MWLTDLEGDDRVSFCFETEDCDLAVEWDGEEIVFDLVDPKFCKGFVEHLGDRLGEYCAFLVFD